MDVVLVVVAFGCCLVARECLLIDVGCCGLFAAWFGLWFVRYVLLLWLTCFA